MTDRLPPGPVPLPPPDRHQIERLNVLYDLSAPMPQGGWRGRIADRIRLCLARILHRQQEFNAAVVDHINRNDLVGIEAHEASARTIAWVQQTVDTTLERVDTTLERIEERIEALSDHAVDEARRNHEASAAQARRSAHEVASIAASQNELRVSIALLQQLTQTLKRDVAGLAAEGAMPATATTAGRPAAPSPALDSLDSHAYVGFEDQFRGTADEVRQRVAEYVPLFQGAQDVLDIGCGRGEFLALLREAGIRARGVDVNGAMVDVCRQQGLDAVQADALEYIKAQPDGSLGGLFAAQVIEHLEPRYLTRMLVAANEKLRPGATIVLETINPACWFAFFESYIRDITHVKPIHPDTIRYLMIASGFQQIEIRYRAPYPEHDKLQPIAPHASLGDRVDTLNANVERVNRLLFTWLDYAAIGRRA